MKNTLRQRIGNAYRKLAGVPSDITPETKVKGGGSKKAYFSESKRDLNKWRIVYETGGVVSSAIDAIPSFCLSKGYRYESDNPKLIDAAWEWDALLNMEQILKQIILDATWAGDSFSELVPGRGIPIAAIIPRAPEEFTMIYDDYGRILSYEQVSTLTKEKKELKPEQILHLQLITSTKDPYGISLVGRAIDEIIRDTKTTEGIAAAIERHGFPKYLINIGQPGEKVPTNVIDAVEKEFKDMNAKNEYVAGPDVRVTPLDVAGIVGLADINNVSIQRLCVALGVPEEILGLGRGSTEATANVRLGSYFDAIAAIQKQVAKTINMQVFDRLTGAPGSVYLVFNDVRPDQNAQKAGWMTPMMAATPQDPFLVLSREWVQEQLGIEPEEKPEEEGLTEEGELAPATVETK